MFYLIWLIFFNIRIFVLTAGPYLKWTGEPAFFVCDWFAFCFARRGIRRWPVLQQRMQIRLFFERESCFIWVTLVKTFLCKSEKLPGHFRRYPDIRLELLGYLLNAYVILSIHLEKMRFIFWKSLIFSYNQSLEKLKINRSYSLMCDHNVTSTQNMWTSCFNKIWKFHGMSLKSLTFPADLRIEVNK